MGYVSFREGSQIGSSSPQIEVKNFPKQSLKPPNPRQHPGPPKLRRYDCTPKTYLKHLLQVLPSDPFGGFIRDLSRS